MARTLVNSHQLAPFSGSTAVQIKVDGLTYAGPGSGNAKDASLNMTSGSITEVGTLYFSDGTTGVGGSLGYESSKLHLYGNTNIEGTLTANTSLTLDSTTLTTAELGVLDGVSAGTAAASKAVVLGGSKEIATIGTIGCGAITSTGNSAFAQGTFSGRVIVDDATDATSATDGSLQTDGGLSVAKDVVAGNDVKLLSDAAVLSFGADSDISLTHVADTGLTMAGAHTNGTNLRLNNTAGDGDARIEYQLGGTTMWSMGVEDGDSDKFVIESGAGVLGAAPAMEIAGLNAKFFGTLECATSLTIGSAAMVEADLEKLDGITNGTAAANKALVADGNVDIASLRNITATGAVTAASFVIGSADIAEAELEMIDGITAGTAAANKAVVLDGSKNIATIGTVGCGAITSTGNSAMAQLTTSGRVIVDDNTAATSTTDGSLQTDGGLSVVLDAVVGDDLIMLSDAAVVHFGADKEVTLTHVADKGLTLTNTNSGDDKAVVFQLKSEEDAVIADEIIASLEFAAGDSDGTDGATVAAGIHAIAEEAFAADANATSLVFTAADSETADAAATPKMTLASTGNLTTAGSVTAVGSFIIGSADMSEADLEKLDGITNGTAAANKAVVLDASADTSGMRNLTLSGDITIQDGGSLKETGGTAAFTFDGSGHVTKIGQDSPNTDEVLTWDGSKWVSSVVTALSGLGSTDNVLLRANGTGGTAAQGSGIAVDDSNNMSGIGTVSCGAITATGTSTFATACNPDAADGATLGGASAEWSDLYLADGGKVLFGNDQDITLEHIADKGLKLSTLAANNGAGAATFASALGSITTHVTSNSPADDDYLGGFFMNGEDDNSDEMTFASVQARIKDASNNSADGALLFGALVNDSMVQVADFGDTAASTWSFVDGTYDVDVKSHDGSNGLKLGGTLVTATAAQLNYNAAVTAGTAAASKAVVLDGSKNIATLGTVGCGAITSTGASTMGSLNIGGTLACDTSFTLDTTSINATELGVLDSVTAGTAAANKALVLDGSKNIATIGTIGCGAITSTGDMLVTADTVTFTSANVDDTAVEIKSTYNGSPGARLKFIKDKGGAGADNDVAGEIQFHADNDAQELTQYGAIIASVADASNGTEGGRLELKVAEHDGTVTTGLKLQDGDADGEIDVTIGAGVNSVVTIPGNLTVTGTTTTVNTVTMEAANAVVFEGATADGNETTLSIVDPTGDHTQYLLNQTGYVPLLAAVTTTTIAATPAEIDAACDASARTAAVVAVADDHFLFCDGAATGATRVESLADLATAQAGAGIAAVSGQFKVDYIIDSCIGSSGDSYASATGVYTLGATATSGSEMVFLNGQVLLPGTSLAAGDYTTATGSVELHPDLKLDGDDVLRVYYLI